MNISKKEQRVLHVLAQGGAIHFDRAPGGKIRDIICVTRHGHVLADCKPGVFERLRRWRFVRSRGGRPYAITKAGLVSVRAQLDNR